MTGRKIFSIAHFEGSANGLHDDTYYQLVKNSSQAFKDEIHDIYFGKIFRFQSDGREKKYSNPMGVEATDAQIDGLFRIQDEFGIEISLTVNSVETPMEFFLDDSVLDQFLTFLKGFYDRGLRSCTFASPHIMRTGVLQANFPEMRWKSTVNHRVATAQQVLDYIFCGYDTILLDRSLSRNFAELKLIRKAVDYYNRTYKPAKPVRLSLLAVEGCLYSCPFKKEHDQLGEYVSGKYFKSTSKPSCNLWSGKITDETWSSKLTCDNWRFNGLYGVLPRNGIDLFADKDTYHEVIGLVDILKFSGRFTSFDFQPGEVGDRSACWKFTSRLIDSKTMTTRDETVYSDNITEALRDNLMPLNLWRFSFADPFSEENYYKNKLQMFNEMPNYWKTKEGKRLIKILKNCRSQCWACHECERTLGLPRFDSALQLRNEVQVADE